MRIVQINAVPYGSTGRIMFQLADAVQEQGGKTLCTAGFTWKKCDRADFIMTSGIVEKVLHTHLSRITGRNGCYSRHATKKLLKQLDAFRPDVIHLHNIHGWYLNLPMLFNYLKMKDIPVVWTLHDCWSFTGQCPHFDMIGCDKYRTGCHHCTLYGQYPKTYFDCSKTMYRQKRDWFTGVKDLTIVTPSKWLSEKVGESFLREYPVQVINNGIDRDVFRPCSEDVRSKYGITARYVLLGVAYAWDDKKGLDAFIHLSKTMGSDYQVVLVGTDENVDRQLPEGVVSIHRTQNPQELAQLYSGADVFVNPTREDTFPTVNMEALACGTPIVSFATGGSPEILSEDCGIVVPKNDLQGLVSAVRRVCEERPFSAESCVRRGACFDGQRCIEEYLELYERITAKGI